MTDNSSGNSFFSPSKVVAGLCGLALVISIFLPWLSPTAKLGTQFSNASALNVSAILSMTGVLGGLLVIGIAWFPFPGSRGYLHLILGLVVLGVLAIMLFNRTLPLLSPLVRSYFGIGPGIYLYVLGGAAVMITGIAERPKASPEMRRQSAPAERETTSDRALTSTRENALPVPNDTTSASAGYCPDCGARAGAGASFCVKCGAALSASQAVSPDTRRAASQTSPRHVSGAWWLMPIFLGLLGGFVAWLAVKKDRPGMALGMLLLGFFLTAVPVALAAVFAYLEG